jgi:hypothetical protein
MTMIAVLPPGTYTYAGADIPDYSYTVSANLPQSDPLLDDRRRAEHRTSHDAAELAAASAAR